MNEWQRVGDSLDTYRRPVEGGWIYRYARPGLPPEERFVRDLSQPQRSGSWFG